MKEDIGYTDGLWNIWDTRAGSGAGDDGGSAAAAAGPPDDSRNAMALLSKLREKKLREKRWAVFLARAVDRYETWWTAVFRPSLTEKDMAVPRSPAYEAFAAAGDMADWWSPTMMLPLGESARRAKRVSSARARLC